MKVILALDLGTSNLKAAALDQTGRVVAVRSVPAPLPGKGVLDVETTAIHCETLIKTLVSSLPKQITVEALVLSSAMHNVGLFDGGMLPLTPMMLWNNDAAGVFGQQLRKSRQAKNWYQRSGVPIHGMSPFVKLMWLRETQPEAWQKMRHVAGIKEYLWYRWFGVLESDRSIASATGLMHLENAQWDDVLLRKTGLKTKQLPGLVWPDHHRVFSKETAARLGIEAGTPCFIGASDGALANLGSGAVETGQAAVTIGTSAALRVITHNPVLDAGMRTFCYRVDGERFIAGGASNNGGNTVAWLHEKVFKNQVPLDGLMEEAAEIPAGSDGLLFKPYLEGERAPVWDSEARASWTGLNTRHSRGHMTRSVLEGVMFNLKVIAESIEEHTRIHTLHAGGGFTQNRLWVQILADVLNKPVHLPVESIDASLYGAVMMVRAGMNQAPMPDLKSDIILPDKNAAHQYGHFFERFKAAKF